MQKLQKYQPRIAVFNGKCKKYFYIFNLFSMLTARAVLNMFVFVLGIYEIFSKEVFGVKVKNLEFGLQPHKIPDTETVSL